MHDSLSATAKQTLHQMNLEIQNGVIGFAVGRIFTRATIVSAKEQ